MRRARVPRVQLLAVAEAWMERVWRQRDVAAIDALHAPTFVDRSPAGRASDRAAYRLGVQQLFAAFPDWYAATDALVPDPGSGTIAIRWSATGTHRAAFLGAPASNRQIRFSGIEILHVWATRR